MFGLKRLRIIPWLLLFEAARTLRSHWIEHLSPDDRRRVFGIVRRTKGDPRRVTAREKADLKAIAGQLELGQLIGDMLPTLARGGRPRGRR